MIGTVIQNEFLTNLDYAGGSLCPWCCWRSRWSGIFLYARVLGARTIEEYL